MNKIKAILIVAVAAIVLVSCGGVSNKTIIRHQKLEEGVESPTTIEELKDAIKKYQERVADVQLAQSQIGIWYKILGTRYLDNKMYGEALKAFQEALTYYPDNQNLYYYVGVCAGYMSHAALDYNASGTNEVKYNYLKLAEEAYLRAIAIEDRYVRALYGLGVLYVFELDEPEKAIPHLEKMKSMVCIYAVGFLLLAGLLWFDWLLLLVPFSPCFWSVSSSPSVSPSRDFGGKSLPVRG